MDRVKLRGRSRDKMSVFDTVSLTKKIIIIVWMGRGEKDGDAYTEFNIVGMV